MKSWSFLTNHALVLVHVGRWPDSTGLEIAQTIGITERSVRAILAELQVDGYIEKERVGRRNYYRVDIHRPLLRLNERELTVGQLLAIVPDGEGPLSREATSANGRTLDSLRASIAS